MANILVRGLRSGVLSRLRQRAEEHNRTLQAELRRVIDAALVMPAESLRETSVAEFLEEFRRLRKKIEGREFSDSVDLIREDREL
jgi:plasmid stability protein